MAKDCSRNFWRREVFDYVLLSGAALLGAFCAYIDGRRFQRPWCALAHVVAFAAGCAIVEEVPASWVNGRLFMGGAYLAASAAVGLAGYLIVGFVFVVARSFARLRLRRKAQSS